MFIKKRYSVVALALILFSLTLGAKPLNDHIMNRPYADLKPWHLGFSVGMQFQDLHFTHMETELSGEPVWNIAQPSASPGFCVNGLVDFRLNTFFNLRFNPGLYFGSKTLEMLQREGTTLERQTVKSTYLVLPFDLKFSSLRYRNSRPYISAGIMPAINLTARKTNPLQFRTADLYLTVGLGCDFYLPFFKLIPEIKFCFGLGDVLKHDRPEFVDDPYNYSFTQSIKKATSSMVVVTFYFE